MVDNMIGTVVYDAWCDVCIRFFLHPTIYNKLFFLEGHREAYSYIPFLSEFANYVEASLPFQFLTQQ